LFSAQVSPSARKRWIFISFGPSRIGNQLATPTMSEPVSGAYRGEQPMRINDQSSLTPRWIVFGTALVYFALGSLLTADFMHLKEGWAQSHRVFRLEIHQAAPGKVSSLKGRLRTASRLQARPYLSVAGYCLPEDERFTQENPATATR
jgi:hypothetical protein